MTVARDRGWHDGNRPICAGCANPIGVRGDPEVAVLTGPVLECVWEGGVWLAHFQCRRYDWWEATPTIDPVLRVIFSRTYRILSDQLSYWLKDPQVVYQGRR